MATSSYTTKLLTSAAAAGALLTLSLATITPARADVWKWVDPLGETHFVDSARPIFVWVDESRSKVYFGDTPGHEDAAAVQLIWHSKGRLDDLDADAELIEDDQLVDETPEQKKARLEAEAGYCQQLTDMHDSYVNAPQLFRTNEEGERENLSKAQARKAIREISDAMKKACQ